MASRWTKLWTASVITVALLSGQGCQARHPSVAHALAPLPGEDAFLPEPFPAPQQEKKPRPPGDRVIILPSSSRYWSSTPTARVFRGSVSSPAKPE